MSVRKTAKAAPSHGLRATSCVKSESGEHTLKPKVYCKVCEFRPQGRSFLLQGVQIVEKVL